jgi:hypothetical protein
MPPRNQREREIAEFIARVASAPVLVKGESGRLICPGDPGTRPDDFGDLAPMLQTMLVKHSKRIDRLHGMHGLSTAAGLRKHAWAEIWDVLNWLLEGESISLKNPTAPMFLENGVLCVDNYAASTSDWLLSQFYALLLSNKRFPFARCPGCRTVFVRARRQRYCSRQCASRGLEAARKGKRREYMRKYMIMRRAKARKAQQKGR